MKMVNQTHRGSMGRGCIFTYIGVSKNSGTPKWMGYTLLKWMIWGVFYRYFWFNTHMDG